MPPSFFDQVEEMDALLLDALGDGQVTYLSRTGVVLAVGVSVEITPNVDRLDTGVLDRSTTFAVRKSLLQPFDRKGAFRDSVGKLWHIDGIVDDDGSLITFYVVP